MQVTSQTSNVHQAASTLAEMLAAPLVPVFNHADAAHARQILGACYAAGIRAFEFTNRGDHTLAVFRELQDFAQQHCPGVQLGIGTIYTAAEAEAFLAAGAAFCSRTMWAKEALAQPLIASSAANLRVFVVIMMRVFQS